MERTLGRRAGVLRGAMIANAVFSLAAGAVLIGLPSRVGMLVGFSLDALYVTVGAIVVGYAVILAASAVESKALDVIGPAAVVADLLWVISTAAVLGFGYSVVSRTGAIVLAGVAIVVGLFGWIEARGIVRMYQSPHARGRSYYEVSGRSEEPPHAIWAVVSDLGSIYRYSPGLTASDVIADPAASDQLTVRQCRGTSGSVWQEECTLVDRERALNVHFRSEAKGFPFPFTAMDGGWSVKADGTGSLVTTWFSFVPKSKVLAFLLVPIAARQFSSAFPTILANMTEAARAVDVAG